MDEYLIKDRSKAMVKDKFFQSETADFNWHVLVHGLLTLVAVSLSQSLLWNAKLSAYSTLAIAGLLASSVVLWLWSCYRQHDLHSRIKKKPDSVLVIFLALILFAVGQILFQLHSTGINFFMMAIVIIMISALFKIGLAPAKSRWSFLLGISILMLISILSDLSVQILISSTLIMIAGITAKRIEVSHSPKDHLLLNWPSSHQELLPKEKHCQSKVFISKMPIGFVKWDNERRLVSINCTAAKIFTNKLNSEPLMGSPIDHLINHQHMVLIPYAEFDQLLLDNLNDCAKQIITSRTRIICKWQEVEVHDDAGRICGGVGYLENVTEHVKMLVEMKHHAYFDLLTGLPNRYRLTEEMARVFSTMQRSKSYCALLFIDLDRFKEINDQWGHNHGDAVLEIFAQRLRKIIRTQETVARLGGDEFVALIESLGPCEDRAKKQAALVAEKIITKACAEFNIDNRVSQIGCSIGITLFNDTSLDSKDLLGQADQALYRIKRSGRSDYVFHEPTATLGECILP